MSLFNCPVGTALPSVSAPSCPNKWDQFVKIFIRRISGRATLTTSTILLSASVSPLLSASDDTKIVVLPYIGNIVIPVGEPIKSGGNDNTTIGGVPRLEGLPFVSVTGAYIEDYDAASIDPLRTALATESSLNGDSNLEGFFVNRFGKVGAINPSSTTLYGVKLHNIVIGDASSEGLGKPTRYPVSFDLAPGWSEGFKLFTPTDYNALTIANS